ncbi:ankyrin repeat protein, partial [Teladorsagia circumcincta]
MAAAGGHANIVKILLENGANAEDENATGLNAMHIAAYYGNSDFVNEMLKSVPASIRSEPPIYNHHVVKEFATEYGFTPLHLAAQSGHDSLVRMLLNQGVQVDATSTTMVCGKGNDNEPLQEFILQSPAPIDTAVKLSALYRDMSEKEKERAKDLSNVAVFSENMAVELLSITATEYNAAILLKAKDNRGRPLLDVLIENEQKEVVSYASVQRYLTEIWTARVDWSFGKTVAFSLFVLICPPAWFYFSLPLDSRI